MEQPESGKALADIVDARAGDLSEESAQLLRAICVEWSSLSSDKALCVQASRIAQTLLHNFPERFNEVAEYWAETLLDDLCNGCLTWLSTHFADLGQEQRSLLADALGGITEGELTRRRIGAHATFLKALDDRGKQTEEMRAHLNYVLDHMSGVLPNQTPAQNPAYSPQVESGQQFLMEVMPTVAPLIGLADEESVAHMVDRIFGDGTNVADDPNLFGALHAEMADHWPDPATSSYDSAAVFDRAEQVCSEHPEAEANVAVLRSTLSLNRVGGMISESSQRRLAGIAANIWPYDPESTENYLLQIEASPEPEITAGIAQDLDLTGEVSERREQLSRVWEHWLRWMSEEEQLEATRALLKVETAVPEQDGDAALRLWIAAMPSRQTVVRQLIQDEEVSDDELARIWWQTCSNATVMGQDFFETVLPEVLHWKDSEKTWTAVIGCQTEVSALFKSQAEKNALGRALVRAYQACPSRSVKGELLRWIDTLKATRVLRKLDEADLSEEDEQQLSAIFGARWRRK